MIVKITIGVLVGVAVVALYFAVRALLGRKSQPQTQIKEIITEQ